MRIPFYFADSTAVMQYVSARKIIVGDTDGARACGGRHRGGLETGAALGDVRDGRIPSAAVAPAAFDLDQEML